MMKRRNNQLKRKKGPTFVATDQFMANETSTGSPRHRIGGSGPRGGGGSGKRFGRIRRFLKGRLRRSGSKKNSMKPLSAELGRNGAASPVNMYESINNDDRFSSSFNLSPLVTSSDIGGQRQHVEIDSDSSGHDNDDLFGQSERSGHRRRTNRGADSSQAIKLVLLLVDPDTRRFEILQLEFESNNILVSEVLSQISESVTEELFRKKTYVGVVRDIHGLKRADIHRSCDFCRGNDVLVAQPKGMSAKETAELATPILTDDNIVEMFKANGVNASLWKKDSSLRSISSGEFASPRRSSANHRKLERINSKNFIKSQNSKSSSSSGSKRRILSIRNFVLVAAFALLVGLFQQYYGGEQLSAATTNIISSASTVTAQATVILDEQKEVLLSKLRDLMEKQSPTKNITTPIISSSDHEADGEIITPSYFDKEEEENNILKDAQFEEHLTTPQESAPENNSVL